MSPDFCSLNLRLSTARKNLRAFTGSSSTFPAIQSIPNSQSGVKDSHEKVLLITPNEINLLHGTGVLLNRLYRPEDAFSIRSREDYSDKGPFSSCVIRVPGSPRTEIFSRISHVLAAHKINSILCVPYYREDYLAGIAAKSILGVPMAVWVMDDSIVYQTEVPAGIASELFGLANVRFAISPEMRDVYERDFQAKFFVLPPTVDNGFLKNPLQPDFENNLQGKICAMVGNIWGKTWLKSFMSIIKASGWTVHWYGKGTASGWLRCTSEDLKDVGIIEKGFVPESELREKLQSYPFAILPTGTGDDGDDRKWITLLSLPTRMPFLAAAARIPILVAGSERSSAAAFTRRFGVGLQCAYDAEALPAAMETLASPSFNAECRSNCKKIAPIFSDNGLAEWIHTTSTTGTVPFNRFEKYFQRSAGELVSYVEEPAPKEIYGDFKIVFAAMRRIHRLGYVPNFIVDVGGSSGVWSSTVHRIFPGARFVLIEPLSERYSNWYHKAHPDFEWVAAAASNKEGKATFQISQDLYGSSLFHPADQRDYQKVEVAVTTLDAVMDQKKITGGGIVKIDVQFAEHLVLEGAQRLLPHVDFLVMELTLKRCVPEARTFLEMVNHMEEAGFQYFDDIGDWRNPVNGILEQKDVIFVKKSTAERLGL
jgi:FkbM family methyltransferase